MMFERIKSVVYVMDCLTQFLRKVTRRDDYSSSHDVANHQFALYVGADEEMESTQRNYVESFDTVRSALEYANVYASTTYGDAFLAWWEVIDNKSCKSLVAFKPSRSCYEIWAKREYAPTLINT
jgi:hypothetical protein